MHHFYGGIQKIVFTVSEGIGYCAQAETHCISQLQLSHDLTRCGISLENNNQEVPTVFLLRAHPTNVHTNTD